MGKPRKMVSLSIEETSGVDHPAHLHEGWIVVKAADPSEVDAVITGLAETTDEEAAMQEEVQARLDEATEALAKAQERIADLEARLAQTETDAPVEDDVLKAAPEAVIKMVEALRAEAAEAVAKAAEAEAVLTAEREAKADEEAIAKAREWSNLSIDPTVIGPALRRIDPDLAKAVEDALTAANAQAESGAIFTEIGKAAPVLEGDAYTKMSTLAKSMVDAGRAATIEQAYLMAASENPDLYTDYLSEKGA